MKFITKYIKTTIKQIIKKINKKVKVTIRIKDSGQKMKVTKLNTFVWGFLNLGSKIIMI